MRSVRAVKMTLMVGVVLLAAVCAYALTRSPPRVLRAESKPTSVLTGVYGSAAACQSSNVLPAGTSAIRLSLAAYLGAKLRVTVRSGRLVLTQGSRGADWTGTSVTVPVRPLSDSVPNVQVCFDLGPNSEPIFLFGVATPAREGMTLPSGRRLPGKIGVEYLAAGRKSWWSSVLTVARHMGLGRAFSGTWVVLLVAAMLAAIGLLAVRVTLRASP
jgi:hypothetical protein